jgi:hypothetical protein
MLPRDPQVTTDPLLFSAAKPEFVETTWVTPELSAERPVLFPPELLCPQVMTDPSRLRAANAELEEKICVTSAVSWLATLDRISNRPELGLNV